MSNIKSKNLIAKFVAFMLIVQAVFIPGNLVHANTIDNVVFGTQMTGNITSTNTQDTYKVVLPKAGHIAIDMKSCIYDVYVNVVDANGDDVISKRQIYYGYSDNPETWQPGIDLEAGTYYIKISQFSDNEGSYNLKVNYTEAQNNDIEPNNGTETAQGLALNGDLTTGFITWNDDIDTYKVVVPRAGHLSIDMKSNIYDVYVNVVDSNGDDVISKRQIYYGYDDNPEVWQPGLDLEAGTYYIKISKFDGNTGKYTLKTSFTEAKNNDVESNNGTETAQNLTLNGSLTTGFISWNDDIDTYKVVVPKAGHLSIDMKSNIYDVYVNVIDSNGDDVISKRQIYYGYDNDPEIWQPGLDLEAGTYYIKISKFDGNTGKYTLKTSFTEAKNNDVESNNGTETAQNLTLNGSLTTGFISWNDDIDTYKVVVPKAGHVIIDMRSNIYNVYANMVDADGNDVISKRQIYYGYDNDPEIWQPGVDLKAGTYYVKISKFDGNTGKYTLKVSMPSLLPTTPVVSEVSNKTTILKGKTEGYSIVTVKAGTRIYTGMADKNGNFSIKIPVQAPGTKIYVYAKNKAGYTSYTRTVTVLDRVAPNHPSINSVRYNSRYITGKAEAYSTVSAYVGSVRIGYAKTDKYGKYSINISSRRAGTKIRVVARDAAGNTSSNSYVTVRR